jgi:site-specific DNA-methyltransferase (adenine-specific)
MPDASVDAVVTDPPYGLEFMGREWEAVGDVRRANRGGMPNFLNESGQPKFNLPAPAFDLTPAGRRAFQEWCEGWAAECLRILKPGGHMLAFGGTRTWHLLASGIESAGAEMRDSLAWLYSTGFPKHRSLLKPAFEPIVVARRPVATTVAANLAEWGVGELHIEAVRGANWPSNVILDSSQSEELDDQAGESARFFHVAKPAADERPRVGGIAHPTVKPLALMRWLVRLVTPPGGTVLEPFAGSGTTVEACILEGFRCIAIEREADYLPLIMQRINRRRDPVAAVKASSEDGGLFDLLGDVSA